MEEIKKLQTRQLIRPIAISKNFLFLGVNFSFTRESFSSQISKSNDRKSQKRDFSFAVEMQKSAVIHPPQKIGTWPIVTNFAACFLKNILILMKVQTEVLPSSKKSLVGNIINLLRESFRSKYSMSLTKSRFTIKFIKYVIEDFIHHFFSG